MCFIPKPFKPQQIFDALKRLLRVEYEYEAIDNQAGTPQDLPKIELPEDLLSRLMQAASDYSITDLSEGIDQVARLGEDAQPLAERLQGLARQYDFDGVLELLNGNLA